MIGSFAGIWAVGQPSFSLKQWRIEMQELSTELSVSKCSVFWYQWRDQEPWRAHVIAMHLQQRTGSPTANGYSGHFPRELWPFENPSGQAAFQWTARGTHEEHHKTRPLTDPNSWCIATFSPEGRAIIRNPKDLIITSTDSVSKTIYENEYLAIGSKRGQLYIKGRKNTVNTGWIQIVRNNTPVASKRGDYKIVNAAKDKQSRPGNNNFLITDRNNKEGIQYIWLVDSVTGKFKSQIMEKIN